MTAPYTRRYDAPMDIIQAERPLEEFRTRVAALPSIWRRRAGDESLATLPGGIRLAVLTSPFIVRWSAWLVALLIVLVAEPSDVNSRFEPWLLMGTFAQLALLTTYVPLFRPWALPRLRRLAPRVVHHHVPLVGPADIHVHQDPGHGELREGVDVCQAKRSQYFHVQNSRKRRKKHQPEIEDHKEYSRRYNECSLTSD